MEVKVRFTKKVFGNDEGFSIYGAIPHESDKNKVKKNKYGNITISGDFSIPETEVGSKYFTATVEEDITSKYDGSYKLIKIAFDFPDSAKDQWSLLEDGGLISMLQANMIRQKFKSSDKILAIIVDNPAALTKVNGIGIKSAEKIKERILKEKSRALIYKEFGSIEGFGPRAIIEVEKMNPSVEESIRNIKADPFILLDIKGIGFAVADRIRFAEGIPVNDRNRCLHGVKHFITDKFKSTGDTYADLNTEVFKLAEALGVNSGDLITHIKNEMAATVPDEKFKLKFFKHYISTQELYNAEQTIYRAVKVSKEDSLPITTKEKWSKAKMAALEKKGFEVAPEQSDFLDAINDSAFLVLLGPGGSGKSWVTKLGVDLLLEQGLKVGLYAPTAQAARVMKDYIGLPSSTIHRGLLPYIFNNDPGGCPDDVLIVDEASMVDSVLMETILVAKKPGARIILIGDSFQLPSVSPGNVLYDLVNNLKVTTVEFTKVYRQEEGSSVLEYAQDLRDGNFYIDPNEQIIDKGDIVFVNETDKERIKEDILTRYYSAIRNYGEEGVMLLTPVNKTEIGRISFNKAIQEKVNKMTPAKSEVIFGQSSPNESDRVYYREGDYITITKNNYNIETVDKESSMLVNGDIGQISHINRDESVNVLIEGKEYTFKKTDVRQNIDHRWAITIHKSQGGQAEEVYIVIPKNSWGISANMLYTAITRMKQKCYLFGDFNSINRAAKRYENYKRHTILSLLNN